jgi:hypothetical protein
VIAPEFQILILNVTGLAVAYLGIYPTLPGLSALRLILADVVVTTVLMIAAGALFWGTGTRFSLVLFSVNWAVFSFVTLLAMEWPLYRWFSRRHGIELPDPRDRE